MQKLVSRRQIFSRFWRKKVRNARLPKSVLSFFANYCHVIPFTLVYIYVHQVHSSIKHFQKRSVIMEYDDDEKLVQEEMYSKALEMECQIKQSEGAVKEMLRGKMGSVQLLLWLRRISYKLSAMFD